jgi:chromatin remodeling complex protein RSC6
MSKTTKSSKTASKTVIEQSTPTPITVTTSSVVEKAPKEKKPKVSKKTDSVVTESVVAETSVTETSKPTIVTAPLLEEALATTEDVHLTEQSVEFLGKLQQLGALISSLKTEYKVLEKKWTRELKASQKLNSKRKRKAGNRAPSGFVKPTRISDELALFLEKPSGSEMARTEVTRDINKYIRSNNLQDKVNGRKINPDSKLTTLLKLSATDELTYFNLQKFMSCHFAKSTKGLTVSSVVEAV